MVNPLISNCPFHPEDRLEELSQHLPEGPIRCCRRCGLHLSSCDDLQFQESLAHRWSVASELDPHPRSLRRLKTRRRTDWFISKCLMRFQSRIDHLDVGCATGTSVSIFQQFGFNSSGIDPSSQPVELGQAAGRDLQVGYLQEAGFPNDAFDVVTMYEVIEHVPDPISLLTEVARILKPGGVVIVGTGNIDSWTRKIRGERWDFFDLRKNGGHVCFYSPQVLKHIAPMFGLRLGWANTYSVKFVEKYEANPLVYHLLKLVSEFLSFPSTLLGRGHQMECFLVKQ